MASGMLPKCHPLTAFSKWSIIIVLTTFTHKSVVRNKLVRLHFVRDFEVRRPKQILCLPLHVHKNLQLVHQSDIVAHKQINYFL